LQDNYGLAVLDVEDVDGPSEVRDEGFVTLRVYNYPTEAEW
jgi:hypothetical protein